jgi:3-oxoacyl-[acyl-carrier-protein] synthase II
MSASAQSRYRVAVTGMGVVAPNGSSIHEFAENLLAGVSGVGTITLFDPTSLPTRIAGQSRLPEGSPLPDRKIAFALEAARQAWAAATSSGSAPFSAADAFVSMGVGLELFTMDDLVASRAPGFTLPASRAERLSFMQTPSDLCVHLISQKYGLGKPPLVHVSACAAGTDAIGAAFRMIASGRRRFALAGGTDSMINPLGVAGFCALNAMSLRNDEPERASRPFDRTRDGFVMGEGAGVLVLERLDDAVARGAMVHAEICGYGNSFDAHGISEPHPDGRGAFQAMSRALVEAGLSPGDIDCVNAHGTATPKNDPAETRALKQLLGERAQSVPVCATKSMIGHLISAAGAVEAIAAIACMERDMVHPTINLVHPDPECDLDYVAHGARRHPQRHVLSASYGFGGQNAAIVIRNGRDALDPR